MGAWLKTRGRTFPGGTTCPYECSTILSESLKSSCRTSHVGFMVPPARITALDSETMSWNMLPGLSSRNLIELWFWPERHTILPDSEWQTNFFKNVSTGRMGLTPTPASSMVGFVTGSGSSGTLTGIGEFNNLCFALVKVITFVLVKFAKEALHTSLGRGRIQFLALNF